MKTIKEIKEQIERLRRVDSEVAQRDLMILEYILEEIIEVRPEEAEVILKELIKVLAEDGSIGALRHINRILYILL